MAGDQTPAKSHEVKGGFNMKSHSHRRERTMKPN